MKVELQIRQVAEAQGIENPYALQAKSGVNYAVCHKLWNGSPKMISLETLGKFCEALNCQPGDLFKLEAGKKDSRRKS